MKSSVGWEGREKVGRRFFGITAASDKKGASSPSSSFVSAASSVAAAGAACSFSSLSRAHASAHVLLPDSEEKRPWPWVVGAALVLWLFLLCAE